MVIHDTLYLHCILNSPIPLSKVLLLLLLILLYSSFWDSKEREAIFIILEL